MVLLSSSSRSNRSITRCWRIVMTCIKYIQDYNKKMIEAFGSTRHLDGDSGFGDCCTVLWSHCARVKLRRRLFVKEHDVVRLFFLVDYCVVYRRQAVRLQTQWHCPILSFAPVSQREALLCTAVHHPIVPNTVCHTHETKNRKFQWNMKFLTSLWILFHWHWNNSVIWPIRLQHARISGKYKPKMQPY